MIPPHIDQILLRKAETAGPTKKMQLVARLLIWFRHGEVVNAPFTDRWREDPDIRRLANRYEARLHRLALGDWSVRTRYENNALPPRFLPSVPPLTDREIAEAMVRFKAIEVHVPPLLRNVIP